MQAQTIRIGCGSGWWRDRIEPAVVNAREGKLDFLCFETMAEATVSFAQTRKRQDPSFPGYETLLEERMRRVIPHCMANGTRIITNGGWINPLAAAQATARICAELGFPGVKITAVMGDDLSERVFTLADKVMETGVSINSLAQSLISAEAYAGADGIVKALDEGAQIVITGRVADPSLFLAPMIHAFKWSVDDADLMAQGSAVGHLLECGAQVTGGYFSDPGFKDVPDPWNLGLPIAEVSSTGETVITKVSGTGGRVNAQTVKEQMFYEVGDPCAYLTPDAVVNFLTARVEEIGEDRVRFSGVTGRPRPSTLKVSMGCKEGFIGEDWFFYAGPGAVARAQLAKRMLEARFKMVGLEAQELRIDFLGINAVHREASPPMEHEPYEVAVRVSARTLTREMAEKIGGEVDGMAVSGIAATGKRLPFNDRTREVIGIWSTLVDRHAIGFELHTLES